MSSIRDPHAAGQTPRAATQQTKSTAPNTKKGKAQGHAASGAASATQTAASSAASPGAAKPAQPSKSSLKQVKQQAMSHGGLAGVLTLRALKGLLSVGGFDWIRTKVCDPVPLDHPPLDNWQTTINMFKGSLVGALSTLIFGGVPFGILGAAMAAAGPAAIPILAVMGGLVVYGTVMGAYQGYKASRPPNPGTIRLNAQSEGQPTTEVTIDHDSQIELEAHHLGKLPTSLPSPGGIWDDVLSYADKNTDPDDALKAHQFQDSYKVAEADDAAQEAQQSQRKIDLTTGLSRQSSQTLERSRSDAAKPGEQKPATKRDKEKKA